MPTPLDRAMDDALGALTGSNGKVSLGWITQRGATVPFIASAPPSLAHFMAAGCAQHRNLPFLIAGEERLTFAQVHDAAEVVARALVGDLGIKKGDRIGLAMRNSPSWVVLYMGIILAGGVATLLNGWWQTEELHAAVRDVECALIFADRPRFDRLAKVAHDLPPIIVIDDTLLLNDAVRTFTAHALAATLLPVLGPDDAATILFTSGSTGSSKGALSAHRSVVQGVFNTLAQLDMIGTVQQRVSNATQDRQPAALLNLPLFHVTAEISLLLMAFAVGRKLVVMRKWDAMQAMQLIEREKVTIFYGVPLMSFEILTHPERSRFDLSTVTDFVGGGAARPPEHVRRIALELEGAPMTGYGLTETQGSGTLNLRGNYIAKPSSVGRVCRPLIELAIKDDAGATLCNGVRGEVCIRSVVNFREYWNNPLATAAAFTDDAYFRTGDIGYLDEDGYLFIVDRKKDIIIRGGENISCQEVEAALYRHPAVLEAAVFGLTDERLGETPGAVVYLRPHEQPTEAQLQAFLNTHIAAFKVPTRIWLVRTPLPRLGTEKIDKVALKRAYREIAYTGQSAATPSS